MLAALLAMSRYPALWMPVDDAQRQVIHGQLEHLLADVGDQMEADDLQARVDRLHARHTQLLTLADQFVMADAMLQEDITVFPIVDAKPGEIVYNAKLGYCLVLGKKTNNPDFHLLTCLQDENGAPRTFKLPGFFYGVEQVLARTDGAPFSFVHIEDPISIT
jgi:hypothetical protein